jgi:hypothetical protein
MIHPAGRGVLVGLLSLILISHTLEASATRISEGQIKQCLSDILQRNNGKCQNIISPGRVRIVDERVLSKDAYVIANIDLQIKDEIGATSEAADVCTGTEWNVPPPPNPYRPNSGEWFMYQSSQSGGSLKAGQGLRIQKSFHFELWDSGWRCAEKSMQPVEKGWLTELKPVPSAGGSPSSILPIMTGAYVINGTACEQASNSTLSWFDGQYFFAGRAFSHEDAKHCSQSIDKRAGNRYTITRSCNLPPDNNPNEIPARQTLIYTIKSKNDVEVSVLGRSGSYSMHYCPQSRLPSMWRGPNPY